MILQNKKKTVVVFHCPSDGKVSLFLEDSMFGKNNDLDSESRTFFCVLCFSFMVGGKRIHLSWIVDDFFP